MRAFIAFEAGECAAVANSIQKELSKSGAKMTFPGEFHVTLAFFDDIEERYMKKMHENLSKEDRPPKFTVTTKGISFFPDEERPKVVWIGLDAYPKEGCQWLKMFMDEGLKKTNLGYAIDRKEFTPHITVARVKEGKIEEEIKQKIAAISKNIRIEFKVDRIHIFKSTLTQTGPLHEKIYSVELS